MVITQGEEELLLKELLRLDEEEEEEFRGFTLPDFIKWIRVSHPEIKHKGYPYWQTRFAQLVEAGILAPQMVKKRSAWGHKPRAYPGYIFVEGDKDLERML